MAQIDASYISEKVLKHEYKKWNHILHLKFWP